MELTTIPRMLILFNSKHFTHHDRTLHVKLVDSSVMGGSDIILNMFYEDHAGRKFRDSYFIDRYFFQKDLGSVSLTIHLYIEKFLEMVDGNTAIEEIEI